MLAQITKWAHQSPLSSLMLKCIKSTWATMLASLLLGALATLGFAPYHQWVLLLISLAFEIFLLMRLRCKKYVFLSLLLYFTALNALTLEWLNFVMTGFGQLPLLASWLIELIFSAYLAFFHALLGTLAFSLALKRLKPTAPAATSDQPASSPAQPASSPAQPAPTQSADAAQSAAAKEESSAEADEDEDYDDSDAQPSRGISSLMGDPELTGGALPGWVPNSEHRAPYRPKHQGLPLL